MIIEQGHVITASEGRVDVEAGGVRMLAIANSGSPHGASQPHYFQTALFKE